MSHSPNIPMNESEVRNVLVAARIAREDPQEFMAKAIAARVALFLAKEEEGSAQGTWGMHGFGSQDPGLNAVTS